MMAGRSWVPDGWTLLSDGFDRRAVGATGATAATAACRSRPAAHCGPAAGAGRALLPDPLRLSVAPDPVRVPALADCPLLLRQVVAGRHVDRLERPATRSRAG